MDQRLQTRSAKQSAALNEPKSHDEEEESEEPPKKRSRSSSRRANTIRADAARLKKLAEQGGKKKLKNLDNFDSEKEKKKKAKKTKKAEKKKLAKMAKLEKLEKQTAAAKNGTDSEDSIQPMLNQCVQPMLPTNGDNVDNVPPNNGSKKSATKRRRHTRASGQSGSTSLANEDFESEDEEDQMELRDPKRRRSVRLAVQKIKKEEEVKQEMEEEEDRAQGEEEVVHGIDMAKCRNTIASIKMEKREPGKAISDAALERLFRLFFPHDNATRDPDDSLLSSIDDMSDGEIERRDAAFRQTMAEIRAFPGRQRQIEALHDKLKTPEGLEALRKASRGRRYRNLSKKQRKEMEERRLRRQKELKEKMEEVIPFRQFSNESESGEFRMELTRSQFAFCLETLSEFIEAETEPATASQMQAIVERISDEELQEKFRIMGSYSFFGKKYFEKKNQLAKIVKELLKMLLSNEKITGVFEKEENGFQFGAYQAVLALADYYSMIPLDGLDIKVKLLVKASWNTDRRTTRRANTNAIVTYCVLDDIGKVE